MNDTIRRPAEADAGTGAQEKRWKRMGLLALEGILLLSLVAYGLHATRPIRDLGAIDGRRVAKAGDGRFDAIAWSSAGPHARGAMLDDLMSARRFRGARGAEVFALLGRSQCYYLDEGNPCYRVTLAGNHFDLRFPVARSGTRLGRVLTVELVPVQ